MRPFGISMLIVGFDDDGSAHLYQTDPSGTYHEWKVCKYASVKKNPQSLLKTTNGSKIVFL